MARRLHSWLRCPPGFPLTLLLLLTADAADAVPATVSVTWSPGHVPASGGIVRLLLPPGDEYASFETGAGPYSVQYLGTGYLHGRAIASFAVLPARGTESTGVSAGSVELRVATRPAAGTDRPALRERQRGELDHQLRGTLAGMVANPETNALYEDEGILVEPRAGGFQPTAYPSLEGSPVDYLIVTTEALSAQYQRLADWKTAKGVRTTVRTVDWIAARTRNGVDLQETMRNFIRDAYAQWGISYVLLGGDTDVLPARYSMSLYGGTEVPTDMYFGCLDGSWNADHDELWGEVPDDDPDLYAEVYNGRIPISEAPALSDFIDKIIAYESAAEPDYLGKYLFLAEVLFPAGWKPGDVINLNGADICEMLLHGVLSTSPMQFTRMYETYNLYPGSVPESRAAALDSMEAGYGFVTQIGHGFRFNMSVGDASILNGDADALANAGRPFHLSMLNCTAAAYDFFCLGEHFLRNPTGGAISVVGANESASATASVPYLTEYHALVFRDDVLHIGEAFARSRLPRTPVAEASDGSDLWTHYIYTFLGDPEMAVFSGPARALAVTFPPAVGLGQSSIAFDVASGGLPADSAVVCLSKDGEDYAVAATDAGGHAVVPFVAESPGSIRFVVTARNSVRNEGVITVNSSPTTYVHLSSVTLADGANPLSSGNRDGLVDAGETIEYGFSLVNSGGARSKSLSIVVRTSHPSVTVLDSTALAPRLDPGQTANTLDPIRVLFAPSVADESVVKFTVQVKSGLDVWGDRFEQVVHAPALDFHALRIDDAPPLGDGDGIVEENEPFKLYYRVKNYGTGTANTVWGRVLDVEGAFTLVDSIEQYPDLVPFASAEGNGGFQLIEANASAPNALLLLVTDAYSRLYRDTLELRPPTPPSALIFDSSLGPDRLRLSWSASPSGDAAHYNVYSSLSSGGPYTRANVDPLGHTIFVHTGLSPITKYYYVVRAVDESGNESAPSAERSASTNPPQVGGFPINLQVQTTSSPAVGDIDGDGDLEIVVGNRFVNAWHHDGQEVRDGDGDAQSWGPVNSAGDGFTAAIALGKIDNEPGLDIVACDLTTTSVYCMNHLGELLPGWPRQAARGFRASPVLGDLDGDGFAEVVAVDVAGTLYAWRRDGAEFRDGDSDPATDGVFFRPPATTFHYQTPGLCDLDGDGREEIILGTRNKTVYALNDDGTSVPGWPFVMAGEMTGGIVTGDVDDDGFPEVVARAVTSEVYLLDRGGSVKAGWPRYVSINQPYFRPSPALADFNGDGTLEIVLAHSNGRESRIYIIDHQGADVPGWPVVYSSSDVTESSPVVADVDGDGALDVVVGDEERFIHAWDAAGQSVDGFPIAVGDAVRATPFVGDIDGDGDADMLVHSWDQNIYVYDLAGSYSADRAPWPTVHGNVYRNGRSGFRLPTGVKSENREPIRRATLLQNRPNPFNPTTRITYFVPDGSAQKVALVIYDVSGRRVRTLVDGVGQPGRFTVTWDGRDDRGLAVASGVYFCRFSTPAEVVTRKMVHLK